MILEFAAPFAGLLALAKLTAAQVKTGTNVAVLAIQVRRFAFLVVPAQNITRTSTFACNLVKPRGCQFLLRRRHHPPLYQPIHPIASSPNSITRVARD
ncbi:hypothetical protein BJ912DRAFT_992847 [Pholiota molesta]|nr:hypothetical protein BJ912DRAFT_992847 [Pholiota molesta]